MTENPQLFQTVLDTTNVRELAEFYRELLGMEYPLGDEPSDDEGDLDWLTLKHPETHARLAFQQVAELTRTTWPDHTVPMQLHLDLVMDDVETMEHWRAWAKEHGATELLDRTGDPDEPLVVLADPSGHPFCLFVG